MLLQQIADYAIKEQTAKLPPEVIHHAKRAVIDWYAALLPGSIVAPATLLEQAFADDLDRGKARLARGRRATIRTAALINGAASHSVEFDDIHRDSGYHPGSPTISAALAVAQGTGATGEQFLRAVIVGYETSTRIGEAVMPSHYNFWHTTGTVGSFGAAASAATANLLRHSLTENWSNFSMGSCDTPITVAPAAVYWSIASAKLCASIVQPGVKAAG